MQCNVGKTDRIFRIVLGIALLAYGVYAQNWWFAIGIVPLGTALFKWCPVYIPFGINTGSK